MEFVKPVFKQWTFEPTEPKKSKTPHMTPCTHTGRNRENLNAECEAKNNRKFRSHRDHENLKNLKKRNKQGETSMLSSQINAALNQINAAISDKSKKVTMTKEQKKDFFTEITKNKDAWKNIRARPATLEDWLKKKNIIKSN